MALLVLIMLGGLLGWIATIVTRTNPVRAILRQMGIGIAVALISGLLANSGSVLGGLSWLALVIAVLATVAALTVYNLVIGRQSDTEA